MLFCIIIIIIIIEIIIIIIQTKLQQYSPKCTVSFVPRPDMTTRTQYDERSENARVFFSLSPVLGLPAFENSAISTDIAKSYNKNYCSFFADVKCHYYRHILEWRHTLAIHRSLRSTRVWIVKCPRTLYCRRTDTQSAQFSSKVNIWAFEKPKEQRSFIFKMNTTVIWIKTWSLLSVQFITRNISFNTTPNKLQPSQAISRWAVQANKLSQLQRVNCSCSLHEP